MATSKKMNILEKNPEEIWPLKIGDRVLFVLQARKETAVEYAEVRWLGTTSKGERIAGLRTDSKLRLGSGWYRGKQIFDCDEDHAVFTEINALQVVTDDYYCIENGDKDEINSNNTTDDDDEHPEEEVNNNYLQLTTNTKPIQIASPFTQAIKPIQIAPAFTQAIINNLCGTPKGIECHNNSCYMDSTLFCMFGFSSVFDYILQPKCGIGDENKFANDIRAILLQYIINPLRTNHFVPASNLMKFRRKMRVLSTRITLHQMDTQEFLELLFKEALKIPEFLEYTNGQNNHFHQILVPENLEVANCQIPTVQLLLERSFEFQALKLKKMPDPVLILQMPRHGIDFKMFNAIVPNLTIDLKDMLDQENGNNSNTATTMVLYAVICIETNHFTSFIRCGNNSNGNSGTMFTIQDPWVFFDSLFGSDDKKDSNNNTTTQSTKRTSNPTITSLPYVGTWLDYLEPRYQNCTMDHVEKFKPELRALISDVYMCFYVPSSPKLNSCNVL